MILAATHTFTTPDQVPGLFETVKRVAFTVMAHPQFWWALVALALLVAYGAVRSPLWLKFTALGIAAFLGWGMDTTRGVSTAIAGPEYANALMWTLTGILAFVAWRRTPGSPGNSRGGGGPAPAQAVTQKGSQQGSRRRWRRGR